MRTTSSFPPVCAVNCAFVLKVQQACSHSLTIIFHSFLHLLIHSSLVTTLSIHLSLTHLDIKDNYKRMLFIDFISEFNTIISQQLTTKLSLLGLNTSLCNWLLDFLTRRPQSVRIGNSTSSSTILNIGSTQGCVLLAPGQVYCCLLFTLLTHDCSAKFGSKHIRFADDTTVVALISKIDESVYMEEVNQLAEWCRQQFISYCW